MGQNRVIERVHLFGIRHHGPGSARSLKAALEALQPDILLVEGPPEAEGILPLAIHEAMRPPVALLFYPPASPGAAAYYPFVEYSPEWQAIRYGLSCQVPVRLMDLPQSIQMAMALSGTGPAQEAKEPGSRAGEKQDESAEDGPAGDSEKNSAPPAAAGMDLSDPLRLLAEAAGYSESEQWWEHLVEQRREPGGLFSAILEAMTALRGSLPAETNLLARLREAAMRQCIRVALADGFHRIAVVCGAWHTAALVHLEGEREDAALLKGLPRVEICATWVPWTNARLTRQSGYSAGIDAPGWYGHLWATESDVTQRWIIRAAQLLRAEDLDISPAHVIEAVRLAEALAALRERPLPGLPELNEAMLTVFCAGSPAPMRLIADRLIIGDVLGSVPPETPMAPLQSDFERESKRLKLAWEPTEKLLDLDLRRPLDLERSHLLHRLRLLEVPWGSPAGTVERKTRVAAEGHGRGGTFHEIWRLAWQPEFALQLIEAGQWGNTIAAAASERTCRAADRAVDLITLSQLVEDVLLAELPEAIEHLMRCLQDMAAISNELRHLMRSLPPLVDVLRYGNVRQTDTAMIRRVVDGLAARVCIGLPGACISINDDAAAEMFTLINEVDTVFGRWSWPQGQDETLKTAAANQQTEAEFLEAWRRALGFVASHPRAHGLLAGRACRLLLDGSAISPDEAARRLRLSLSTGGDPLQSAAWVEGFLHGSGQLLIHDDALLGLIDGWLASLPGSAFPQLLPILRRAFASFSLPERRSIGERVRRRGSAPAWHNAGQSAEGSGGAASPNFDSARADAVLPMAARLLGISPALPGETIGSSSSGGPESTGDGTQLEE